MTEECHKNYFFVIVSFNQICWLNPSCVLVQHKKIKPPACNNVQHFFTWLRSFSVERNDEPQHSLPAFDSIVNPTKVFTKFLRLDQPRASVIRSREKRTLFWAQCVSRGRFKIWKLESPNLSTVRSKQCLNKHQRFDVGQKQNNKDDDHGIKQKWCASL